MISPGAVSSETSQFNVISLKIKWKRLISFSRHLNLIFPGRLTPGLSKYILNRISYSKLFSVFCCCLIFVCLLLFLAFGFKTRGTIALNTPVSQLLFSNIEEVSTKNLQKVRNGTNTTSVYLYFYESTCLCLHVRIFKLVILIDLSSCNTSKQHKPLLYLLSFQLMFNTGINSFIAFWKAFWTWKTSCCLVIHTLPEYITPNKWNIYSYVSVTDSYWNVQDRLPKGQERKKKKKRLAQYL